MRNMNESFSQLLSTKSVNLTLASKTGGGTILLNKQNWAKWESTNFMRSNWRHDVWVKTRSMNPKEMSYTKWKNQCFHKFKLDQWKTTAAALKNFSKTLSFYFNLIQFTAINLYKAYEGQWSSMQLVMTYKVRKMTNNLGKQTYSKESDVKMSRILHKLFKEEFIMQFCGAMSLWKRRTLLTAYRGIWKWGALNTSIESTKLLSISCIQSKQVGFSIF